MFMKSVLRFQKKEPAQVRRLARQLPGVFNIAPSQRRECGITAGARGAACLWPYIAAS